MFIKNSKLAKYILIFKNNWQYEIEYRLNALIWLLVSFITFAVVIFLWNDIYSAQDILGDYDKKQMITYYLITVYLLATIYPGISVTQDIRSGRLSTYLTKPTSYIIYKYVTSLSKRLFRLVFGLPILIIIFFIFNDSLLIVIDPLVYVFFIITILGAINILFLIDLIASFVEFWITYSENVSMLAFLVTTFFSGTLLPLFLFPPWLQSIANWLPFKYTTYFIVNSLVGKSGSIEMLFGIGIQIIWTIVLGFISTLLWKKGLKKYEAFGN